MSRESLQQKRRRAHEILKRLHDEIPEAECALHFGNTYQLLVAVILSAQCTDERVNKVTPALFAVAPTPEKMIALGERKLQNLIKSINFFKTKARNIYAATKILLEKYQGQIPQDLESLIELPGVGRKTANVILGVGYRVPRVVVDTHVRRVSNRLRLTTSLDPDVIEEDLEKVIAQEEWIDASHLFILHGRRTCIARKPACERCVIASFCPSRGLDADIWKEWA